MRQRLTLVFKHETSRSLDTWELIAAYLKEKNLAEIRYQTVGGDVPFEKIAGHIKKRGKPYFNIEGRQFSFTLAAGGSLPDVLTIESDGECDWGVWVQKLRKAGDFIQAYVVDVEYAFWQNAKDPLEYKVGGRSLAHLPMISNGLPFPLEQKVVDTSKNPGRRILRDEYIEEVAAHMWFGKDFWKLTGSKKERLEAHGFHVKEEDGITEINLGSPFIESSDMKTQEVLRQCLFPGCCAT